MAVCSACIKPFNSHVMKHLLPASLPQSNQVDSPPPHYRGAHSVREIRDFFLLVLFYMYQKPATHFYCTLLDAVGPKKILWICHFSYVDEMWMRCGCIEAGDQRISWRSGRRRCKVVVGVASMAERHVVICNSLLIDTYKDQLSEWE